MKMSLQDYEDLPDAMSEDKVCELFEQTIAAYENNEVTKSDFLEMMMHVANRQGTETFRPLNAPLRKKIDELMCQEWNVVDFDNFDEVELITGVLLGLGLVRSFELMKQTYNTVPNLSKEVRDDIEQTIRDAEGHIEDPFYSWNKKYENAVLKDVEIPEGKELKDLDSFPGFNNEGVPHPTVDGITVTKYRVPDYNEDGTISLHHITHSETLYHRKFINDDKMEKWAIEAFKSGHQDAHGRIFAQHSNGLRFIAYTNKDGDIDDYYPLTK